MRHPKEEKTVVLVKPDGVKRGLVGEIMSRIERRGLKIIALEMITITREQIDEHYPKDERWIRRLGEKSLATYQKYGWDPVTEMGTDDPAEIGKSVRSWILDYMISGPIVKMVVEGIHAVDMVRKLSGNTVPAFAEMGTIRGDFSVDSAALANKGRRAIHNLIHASETLEEAEHELEFWFGPEEIHNYKRAEEDIMF
ncbi:MAG: nucleoside-diphosphate kinase [Parcubacteria group bacterium RIFCSPLOWO2_01_FULL_48_18]|nr:MAG: nucleoside-diphosphate kinase [Parcubacteria group bacterium RIFCSPLOWO2_01_FULL_48_18]OHB22991.1 MAG: nucleoside-diphosphate kinase [Parcubacteria group bacterium RIFCSPHIGHO2_02_FULL_48_10b]